MNTKDRIDSILKLNPENYVHSDVIGELVGDDLDAFKALLQSNMDQRLKLSPLTGDPSKHLSVGPSAG